MINSHYFSSSQVIFLNMSWSFLDCWSKLGFIKKYYKMFFKDAVISIQLFLYMNISKFGGVKTCWDCNSKNYYPEWKMQRILVLALPSSKREGRTLMYFPNLALHCGLKVKKLLVNFITKINERINFIFLSPCLVLKKESFIELMFIYHI